MELCPCLCRNQLKAQYLMSLETSEGLLEAVGSQALAEGTYHTPEAMSQKIDAVSSNDVVNVSIVWNTPVCTLRTVVILIKCFFVWNPGDVCITYTVVHIVGLLMSEYLLFFLSV